jgi:hypothetical protein
MGATPLIQKLVGDDVARELTYTNRTILAAKRILNNAPFESAADILLAESRVQDQIIGTSNQVEAVMANMEQRSPNLVASIERRPDFRPGALFYF